MKYDIVMPKLGGANKYKLTRFKVALGQEVQAGDLLFEVEAGKSNKPVHAEYSGIVEELIIEPMSEVEVGEKVLVIEGAEGQKASQKPAQASAQKPAPAYGGGLKAGYFNIQIKKEKKNLECDIAILGGGPGGYVAAIKAAQMNKKVILVEKEKMGGTCLNRGCIPTKAIIRSVEVLENIKDSQKYGLGKFEGSYDLGQIIERKNTVVDQLVAGIEHLMNTNSITVVYGKGKLQATDTIEVEGREYDATIKAENIILATGSEPANLPIPGIELEGVLNSTDILHMTELPSSMVIVGGGVIGMEFAFIFNSLGVKVSVVEMLPHILPLVDKEIAEELTNAALEKGIKIYTEAKVEGIEKLENNDKLVIVTQKDKKLNLVGEKVFISIGRTLNTKDIGLDTAGIEMEGRAIKVDEKLRTNVENIYAIGDVNGKYMLAHVASMEGLVAVENILGQEKKMQYNVIPSAVFTHPEIASVGLTEQEALDKGYELKIGRFPYGANGKALAAGEEAGLVKIISDQEGKILGGWIIGYNASDLIPQITLAMENSLTAEDVAKTVYAHPTISECVAEACHGILGHAIHLP